CGCILPRSQAAESSTKKMATSSSLNTEVKKGKYITRKSGRPFTKDFRIFFERADNGVPVSPFHDIPLYHDRKNGILNMVVEIPRWSNAKFEVSYPPR